MKTLATALLATLPLIAACSDHDRSTPAGASARSAQETMIGRKIREAMEQARAELATENIRLGELHVSGDGKGVSITAGDRNDGRPKAEITPRGELLIDGRKVETDAAQRALLLQYRRQIEGIAAAGMDLGAAGAELGVSAATEALRGVFSGDPDRIERRVEARAEGIKAAAVALCDRLPALLETQDRLAAALPEFRPYADLDKSDIDECRDGGTAGMSAEERAKMQRDIRDGIRNGVRGGVQAAAQATGLASSGTMDDTAPDDAMNAAEEAEAASAENGNSR